MRRILCSLALITACSGGGTPEPEDPTKTPDIYTPRWAFEPWISKDISDGPDTYAFVEGFKSRDIPVGVVVLDSPWETDYNTFDPNPERYPEMPKMIADLRAEGVRTVLWITQMLNVESFDVEAGGDTYDSPSVEYLIAEREQYFVNDGETFFWWKGKGSGIDFSDDVGRAWWHGLQDDLLDAGIAGWKLDFGESYVMTDTVKTDAGVISHQEYSEEYYRDFWAYGANRLGTDEFVTMVRPYDKSYNFEGRFFARPEHAPVTWVGDNRRDYVGMIDALDHMFRSAEANYVVIGSDIGGYLDRDDQSFTDLVPYDTDTFLRWTALGAMTPFMQLHGRANLEPWSVPERADETVDTYRYWATLHHELVPFLYSLAEDAYDAGGPMMHPIGDGPDAWEDDWRFVLGEAFLVAPIFEASGVRDVPLPGGASWYDWWAPQDDAHDGGTTLAAYDVGSPSRIPLFVRAGAIVPMTIDRALTEIGTEAFAGHLTVLVYPGATASSFVLRDSDDGKTEIAADGGAVSISRTLAPTIFVVRTDTPPTEVEGLSSVADVAAVAASNGGWFYDASRRATYVKVAASSDPTTVTIR
ncbi:MAG: glycoside hydrolase family 31 protein [Deltaproteobacteria bacterium]